MDFQMCRDAFTGTELYGWNGTDWEPTGCTGSLQVYDRFISERSFGQKKRIFTTSSAQSLDPVYNQVRIGDGTKVYMVEWVNEDIEADAAFGSVLSLREASVHGGVYARAAGTVRGSGIPTAGADVLRATVWADLEFFGDVRSSEFESTKYTVHTLVLPEGTPLNSDNYFRDDAGKVYEVLEVFSQLRLPAARVQRVG